MHSAESFTNSASMPAPLFHHSRGPTANQRPNRRISTSGASFTFHGPEGSPVGPSTPTQSPVSPVEALNRRSSRFQDSRALAPLIDHEGRAHPPTASAGTSFVASPDIYGGEVDNSYGFSSLISPISTSQDSVSSYSHNTSLSPTPTQSTMPIDQEQPSPITSGHSPYNDYPITGQATSSSYRVTGEALSTASGPYLSLQNIEGHSTSYLTHSDVRHHTTLQAPNLYPTANPKLAYGALTARSRYEEPPPRYSSAHGEVSYLQALGNSVSYLKQACSSAINQNRSKRRHSGQSPSPNRPPPTPKEDDDSGEPLYCEICHKAFTGRYRRGNKKRHVNNMHCATLDVPPERICREPSCRKVFNRADATRKHEWKKHVFEDARPEKRAARPEKRRK